MPCLAAPRIPDPDFALSLLLPDLGLSAPSLGIAFCCAFETPPIPGFPVVLPIGTLLAILGGPALDALLATIKSVVALLNALLDQIPPVDCPLD